MDLIKVGKRGQVSIPKSFLDALALQGEQWLSIEMTPDGAISLKPVSIAPMELYSEDRLVEFAAEDELTPALAQRLAADMAQEKQT
jgi:bifunctional DNA-binding transcriptional regulator/antitoxin component of YhaV-PrlF toxin-antitoxin module